MTPARRITQPTGQPVVVHGPTRLAPIPLDRFAHPLRGEPLDRIGKGEHRVWPEPCGTHAAANRHRKRGEPVCEACRIADAAYTRQLRARRRGQVDDTARRVA